MVNISHLKNIGSFFYDFCKNGIKMNKYEYMKKAFVDNLCPNEIPKINKDEAIFRYTRSTVVNTGIYEKNEKCCIYKILILNDLYYLSLPTKIVFDDPNSPANKVGNFIQVNNILDIYLENLNLGDFDILDIRNYKLTVCQNCLTDANAKSIEDKSLIMNFRNPDKKNSDKIQFIADMENIELYYISKNIDMNFILGKLNGNFAYFKVKKMNLESLKGNYFINLFKKFFESYEYRTIYILESFELEQNLKEPLEFELVSSDNIYFRDPNTKKDCNLSILCSKQGSLNFNYGNKNDLKDIRDGKSKKEQKKSISAFEKIDNQEKDTKNFNESKINKIIYYFLNTLILFLIYMSLIDIIIIIKN